MDGLLPAFNGNTKPSAIRFLAAEFYASLHRGRLPAPAAKTGAPGIEGRPSRPIAAWQSSPAGPCGTGLAIIRALLAVGWILADLARVHSMSPRQARCAASRRHQVASDGVAKEASDLDGFEDGFGLHTGVWSQPASVAMRLASGPASHCSARSSVSACSSAFHQHSEFVSGHSSTSMAALGAAGCS